MKDKKNGIYSSQVLMLLIFTVSLCIFFAAPAETSAKKSRQLVVLHSNDSHSTIMPVSALLPDTMKAGRGGFLRRIALLQEERRQHPDLLYFDSGDFSQGSAYYTLFKGDVEVGLMNLMGLDAVTIGNHEFDFGLENMARLFRMANFPIVCANYDFKGTPCEGLVKPYVILHRQGLKIGVFGLSPKMEGLVAEKNCQGVKYLDPVETARQTAALLKEKKKCDVVICLSHMGWGEGPEYDTGVIQGSRYIDLVLGGHTHTYMKKLKYVKDLDGRDVPVDQNGKHAIWVGKMVLTVE